MIKIECIDVNGFKSAFRGMRNPLNSWDKSDSNFEDNNIFVGERDLKLAQNLIKAGTDESKFLRYINVTMDITAPIYWWKEFDAYKVGTIRNSCSTMHKIHDKPIELSDFSIDNSLDFISTYLYSTITTLESLRQLYIDSNDKKYWRALIQLLPESYNQKSTVQLNYQVLRNIYNSRKNHKLQEWRDFCNIIKEELPYSNELIII